MFEESLGKSTKPIKRKPYIFKTILFILKVIVKVGYKQTITELSIDTAQCSAYQKTQNVFGTNKMIIACNWPVGKGFNLFDYDTRATNNGFSHEVASGHLTSK